MKKWSILGAVILLAGCAAKTWQQVGKSQQDFYADSSSCQAMANTAYRHAPQTTSVYVYNQNGYTTAYTGRGGTFAQGFLDERTREAPVTRLYQQCMMGKGWHKGQNMGRSISVQPLPIRTEPIRTVSPTPVDDSEHKPSSLGNVYLQYDNMQLRSQPGFSGNVIETINTSTVLQALNETDYWVEVRTPSGKEGWVAKNWLKQKSM
jgi:uncharacterized protein YgiM (DUF1202 family)